MKRLFALMAILSLAVFGLACEAEQTGEDTYQIETPTDEAEAAGEELQEETYDAAQETETALEELGDDAESALDEAGDELGEEMEEQGQDLQDDNDTDTY